MSSFTFTLILVHCITLPVVVVILYMYCGSLEAINIGIMAVDVAYFMLMLIIFYQYYRLYLEEPEKNEKTIHKIRNFFINHITIGFFSLFAWGSFMIVLSNIFPVVVTTIVYNLIFFEISTCTFCLAEKCRDYYSNTSEDDEEEFEEEYEEEYEEECIEECEEDEEE